ncbi:MAG: potassium transporter TrkA [Chloroflexi bacterium]|nr:MAG: potassium transporter TrkA [Chloroflexota bacterium]
MQIDTTILIFILSFGIVALASKEIGAFFARYKLPLISGFLFAGILVGPYLLNIIPREAISKLRFVDEISLAYIAFAAGSELYLKELRSRFKSIAWVTIGLVLATSIIGSFAFFFLTKYIPFTQGLSISSRIAISVLAGAILVARSPSSAIAIVNELRAKGPFTQTMLGVTVIMDVVVIILFAFNSEIAEALLTNISLNLSFIVFLLAELALSIFFGYLLGKLIEIILYQNLKGTLKGILLLSLGYFVFLSANFLHHYSFEYFGAEILLEPLLICMVASFFLINWTPHRDQLLAVLHDLGPTIYIVFFTLTGASLALDVLAKTWQIALALFFIRLLSIFIGSFLGGTVAGEPMKNNTVSWMAYVTQAGVGLGLAKEVAVEFPQFGLDFATIIIAVIVLNQIAGPPLFKWVINYVGEAHPRGESTFDGTRDAFIFGTDDQARALARLLKSKGWQIRWICPDASCAMTAHEDDEPLSVLTKIDFKNLESIEANKADAVITMLSDDENYRLCELFYEHYGTKTLVTRLHNPANRERFLKLGVLIVYPGTATARLLDQYARKPDSASLLLDSESKHQIREISVRDPNLHGIALRDLRLPSDTLIIAIHRGSNDIISHGYTRLRLGDRVTVIGSPQNLEEITLKLEV